MTASIRLATPQDAAAVQAIYAPYCEASAISFEDVAPTVEQTAERMASVSAQFPWLVCEIDRQVVGYVYACRHRERAAYRWAVDVAVYVDSTYHRRGIGRALYTSLIALVRQQGYVKAYAGITLPNPGSVGVHETVGFRRVAVYRGVGFKLGQWRDVGWWELALAPESAHPREPRPVHAIDPTIIAAALAEGQSLLR